MRLTPFLLAASVMLVALAAACGGSAAPTAAPSPTATAAPVVNTPTQPAVPATATAAATVAAPTNTRAPTAAPTNTPAPTAAPPTSAPASNGPVINADIRDFSLPVLSVPVGATVVWTNRDAAPHTTTAGAPGKPSRLWNSGPLATGMSFQQTFAEAGEFQYFCSIHTDMEATVKVGAATTDPVAPTAAAAPTQASTAAPQAAPTATPALPPAATATSAPQPAAGPRQSAIKGFALESFTIPAGTAVVWQNQDNTTHTVTAPMGLSPTFAAFTPQ